MDAVVHGGANDANALRFIFLDSDVIAAQSEKRNLLAAPAERAKGHAPNHGCFGRRGHHRMRGAGRGCQLRSRNPHRDFFDEPSPACFRIAHHRSPVRNNSLL